MGNEPLKGVSVLVTRPAAQANSLCSLIESRGGQVHRFPVLEIFDLPDGEKLQQIYDRLANFDLVIFVSVNAVRKAMDRVLVDRPWPSHVKVAAVGPSTIEELGKCGISAALSPQQQFDSEGLLQLEELHDVQGKRILIFRGQGGRSLLGDTLRERGAEIEYGELYSRGIPNADIGSLLHQFESDAIDVITVSSLESLRNLIQMLGSAGLPWIRKTPVVVVNHKMADLLLELGSEYPALKADNATDQAVVNALLAWVANKTDPSL